MKNYVLIGLMISSFATAGGDIDPIEPTISVPDKVVYEDRGNDFYIGLGYSYLSADIDREETGNAYTLLAGYKFHEYLATEFRYTRTIGDEMDVSGLGDRKRLVSNKALYLKPQYALTKSFDIYALLGYGEVIARDTSDRGFEWGIGAEYHVTEDISIFADYISMYDDTLESVANVHGNNIDSQIVSSNIGVKYHF